jgi:CheY-like chemotaxis protein
MSRLSGKSLVVFDASAETVIMLEAWFETLGVAAHGVTDDVTAANVNALIDGKRPDVIIFDVPMPYHENLHILHDLMTSGAFANVPVIVTTTNTRVVSALARANDLVLRHLVEKPYDMDLLMQRVTSALASADDRPLTTPPDRGRGLRRMERIAPEAARREPKTGSESDPTEPTECRGSDTDCYVASALRREFQQRRERWLLRA